MSTKAAPPVGTTLLLPCETQARELDAKLLLAAFAAERGFRVVVGAKKELDRCIGAFPRGIYLSKSLTVRNRVAYQTLRRLGHAVVCGDEEGLVWPSPESYLHAKVHGATLRGADLLLAWGSENARVWRECPDYHGAPIHAVGNARMDLLRPELRGLHDPAVAALRERLGPFVLLNTNFSRMNHYLPSGSRQKKQLDAGGSGRSGDDLDTGLAAHKAALFDAFKQLVPRLADALGGHTLVVRPHPSERQETWHEVARGRDNVRVLHEGSVVPWILAADAVVHNGCTTAVEAYLLGRPAIAYQPVVSERFDLQLPNLMSRRAFSDEALVELVQAHVEKRFVPDPNEVAKQEELIDEYVSGRRDGFASERIVDALVAFAPGSRIAEPPPWLPRFTTRAFVAGRRVVRQVEARIPGHHNSRVYLRHMFPGIAESEARERIAAYGRALGRFSGLRVDQRFENVFEVRRG
ncbi:MAG: hypothetical protein QNK05_04175 [Myxococcota bacterium]|nr:hypothetical protein [Myxococcota bacterium]